MTGLWAVVALGTSGQAVLSQLYSRSCTFTESLHRISRKSLVVLSISPGKGKTRESQLMVKVSVDAKHGRLPAVKQVDIDYWRASSLSGICHSPRYALIR